MNPQYTFLMNTIQTCSESPDGALRTIEILPLLSEHRLAIFPFSCLHSNYFVALHRILLFNLCIMTVSSDILMICNHFQLDSGDDKNLRPVLPAQRAVERTFILLFLSDTLFSDRRFCWTDTFSDVFHVIFPS